MDPQRARLMWELKPGEFDRADDVEPRIFPHGASAFQGFMLLELFVSMLLLDGLMHVSGASTSTSFCCG